MQAVRLYEYGGPDKLKFEENVPDPTIAANGLLINATASSVNPIDWKIRSGARQKDFPQVLPVILGRDVSGTVVAVGASVTNFKAGDRVIANTFGSYAALVTVEAAITTHLPDGVDPVDAAGLPLAVLTGDQLIRDAAKVQRGQTVVITGALGSVGRAAVHAASKLGARVIAGVRQRQLEEARKLNVADVLAIDDDAAIAALNPVDTVADTVGGETAAKILGRIKPGGSFGYASALAEGAAARNPSVVITRVFAMPDASKVREFADDVRDGKFRLPIGARFHLRDIVNAHITAERGGVGKVILLAR